MDGAELPTALELPALPASVTEARRVAARLAYSFGADSDAVALAVAEAVGNAVIHAYPERPPGTVRMALSLDSGILVVVVSDDGVGMRPNPDSQGLGIGLPLIAQVSDGVEIAAGAGGGTELRMRFPVAAGRPAEACG
jgi:anti-sigma regulatory factor (Ser/Thr protein kinase)